jgi:hypothetical protein
MRALISVLALTLYLALFVHRFVKDPPWRSSRPAEELTLEFSQPMTMNHPIPQLTISEVRRLRACCADSEEKLLQLRYQPVLPSVDPAFQGSPPAKAGPPLNGISQPLLSPFPTEPEAVYITQPELIALRPILTSPSSGGHGTFSNLRIDTASGLGLEATKLNGAPRAVLVDQLDIAGHEITLSDQQSHDFTDLLINEGHK